MPWGMIASAAVPWILNTVFGPKPPKAPPKLGWDEASRQAGEVLNPLYDKQLETTLSNVDKQSIGRGFYGQMPADALRGSRAADVETARAGQIAALANQMRGQSQQEAFQSQQLATQQALQQQQIGLGAFGMGMQGALEYYDRMYKWPWQKEPELSPKQKYELSMQQIQQGVPGYDALSTYKPRVTNEYGLGLNASWSNPFKW